MGNEMTLAILESTIGNIISGLASSVKKKYKIESSKLKIAELHDHIKNIEKVKTIWQIDKEVKISEFYYPVRVVADREEVEINSIDELPAHKNNIIQGIAGQGKSIFLRHLCANELKRGEYIPIFLELRHIDDKLSLKELLFSTLSLMGLDFDDFLFEYFANSGKVALLLDGFDEISARYVDKTIVDLEYFCQKFNKLPVIVSSRPNSDIQYSPHFRILRIANLDEADRNCLIIKLVDSEQSSLIIDSIEKKPNVAMILTTPLLITLLIITYKSYNEIPDQLSEFYEALFLILLRRHDKSKAGYTRERKTKLSDSEIQEVFEKLCFLTLRVNKSVFVEEEILRFCQEALIKQEMDFFKFENFLEDIIKITCLIIKDGVEYRFIHKSIQEYYAARFVRRLPEGQGKVFYEKVGQSENAFVVFRQTMHFLREVDEYRFCKFFALPSVMKLFELKPQDISSLEIRFSRKDFLKFMKKHLELWYRLRDDGKYVMKAFFVHGGISKGWAGYELGELLISAAWDAVEEFRYQSEESLIKLKANINERADGEEGYCIFLEKFLDESELWETFLSELNKNSKIASFVEEIKSMDAYVNQQEKIKDEYFDFNV